MHKNKLEEIPHQTELFRSLALTTMKKDPQFDLEKQEEELMKYLLQTKTTEVFQ